MGFEFREINEARELQPYVSRLCEVMDGFLNNLEAGRLKEALASTQEMSDLNERAMQDVNLSVGEGMAIEKRCTAIQKHFAIRGIEFPLRSRTF